MLKKFGMVSVGVTAALLAAAPLASASECHDGHDKGHHEGHHQTGGHENVGNTQCAAKSGDVKNNDSKGLLAGVGPILDGNAGQILSCNSFLNDNLSNNDLNIANGISL